MNADDARRIIAEATPASADEAEAGIEGIRTDPVQARLAFMALMTMAADDPAMNRVADVLLKSACMRLVLDAMERDDAYALAVGRMLAYEPTGGVHPDDAGHWQIAGAFAPLVFVPVATQRPAG